MPTFKCDSCGFSKEVPDKADGCKVKCPECGQVTVINLDDCPPSDQFPTPPQAAKTGWGLPVALCAGVLAIGLALVAVSNVLTAFGAIAISVGAIITLVNRESRDQLFGILRVREDTHRFTVSGVTLIAMVASYWLQGVNLLAPPQSEPKWPYKYVAKKTQINGTENVMELYAYSGPFDVENLKDFCWRKKREVTNEGLYYLVIFDDPGRAEFPTKPFTAEYGTEKSKARNIRALLVYNAINGFCELRYYKLNMAEGSSVIFAL